MSYPTKKLGEVASIKTGKLDANAADADGVYPFYTCSREISRISKTVFDGESILIAGNGEFWVKYHENGKFNAYQRTYVVQANDEILTKYLFFNLTIEVPKLVSQGGVIQYLRLPQLKNIEIPLPPLEEQKKIVAKLERVLAKISEAKKLRAEARESADNLLPAELHKIFEEGKKKGWEEKELGKVCEIARGGSPRPIQHYLTDSKDGINWVKISDATSSTKYIHETKQKITKEGLAKTRLVKPGDFILTNSMSFGRPYIMKTTGAIHDGWLLLRPQKSLTEECMYYFLSSDEIYSQFSRLAGGAVVQNLNSELVRSVEILIPPLAAQKKIVARLDSLSEKIGKIKNLQSATQNDFIALEQSVLSKAFTAK